MPIVSGGSSLTGSVTLLSTLSGDGTSGLFDFQSIAATYNRLQLVVMGRSNAAATSDDVYIRFNNDSGANYDWNYLRGTNSVSSSSQTFADTNGIYCFATTAATGTASYSSCLIIDIPFYAATVFNKQLQCTMFEQLSQAAAGINRVVTGGTWRSTAAISRVTVRLASGSWITGSTALLYGIL